MQWLQAYEVDPQTVRTVYATLGSVFGSVETFSGKNDDLLLVSSEKPIRYDADFLSKRLAEEPFASAMQDAWRVVGLEGFLSHYVARDSLARAIVRAEAGRVNRDDRNVVEFAFARSLGQGGLFQGDELRVLAQAARREPAADRGHAAGLEPRALERGHRPHGGGARGPRSPGAPTTSRGSRRTRRSSRATCARS